MISRWESGEERCHPKHWDKLAEALGVTIETLFTNQLRSDIIDELVERGYSAAMAQNAYDGAIGPMISERLAGYDTTPAHPLLAQIISAWPKLSAEAKLKMISLLAEIKSR